ncbi:MAG: hypothetical protein WBE26_05605 [Phycisphaerae bacterium]
MFDRPRDRADEDRFRFGSATTMRILPSSLWQNNDAEIRCQDDFFFIAFADLNGAVVRSRAATRLAVSKKIILTPFFFELLPACT